MRDAALRKATAGIKRAGYVPMRVVGAVRYFSLRSLWFRWSIGFEAEDVKTGELVLGHVCLELSDRTGRVLALEMPPQNAYVFDRWWRAPEPLWWRLALCVLVPPGVVLSLLIWPFAEIHDTVSRRVVYLLTPRCPRCRRKLRSRRATRCFAC